MRYLSLGVTIKNMDLRKSFGSVAGYVRRSLQRPYVFPTTMYGKVTLLTTVGGALLGFFIVGGFFLNVDVPKVSADNVTTSVTVLNTPPVWTVQAAETVPSATSTPTNAGATITWTATGTDSNNDNYWLIICKTSALPTANSSSTPTCGGGIANQWAASPYTLSGQVATAATTTKEGFPFNNEKNDWFAWICDGNISLPQCNPVYSQGSGDSGSPFVINHPPGFTAIVNNAPQIPGNTITWTATGYDPDMIRGGDSIKLYVCKAADFTGTTCGAGGYWASSTIASTSAVASYTIPIPTQDTTYNSYTYVVDNMGLAATSTLQGTNSSFAVSAVAPVVTASTITVVNYTGSGNLALVTPNGKTSGYKVTFQVSDNNSCLKAAGGNEISSVAVNVFRSGIGSTSCLGAGWNSNNCYPSNSGYTDFSCSQDGGSCSGATDSTATFTCTFSMWYNADPTDVGSQYAGQKWSATAQATNYVAQSSPWAEATVGSTTMTSFLAFSVSQSSIAFGGLQPGQQNDPLSTTTQLNALGNVGVDESLYGDTMCTTWSGPDSCDHSGFDNTKDIGITNQKAATSSVAYASSFAYALSGSTTPVTVGIHVQKTTSTSSPQNKLTYWAIKIPATITLAGNYTGQDTITAVTSAAANW